MVGTGETKKLLQETSIRVVIELLQQGYIAFFYSHSHS